MEAAFETQGQRNHEKPGFAAIYQKYEAYSALVR
jgi:hypothetical protein